MEYLIQFFGGISFGSVIIFIAALSFFIGVLVKAYKAIISNHDYFQDKEKTFEDIKEDLKEIKQTQEVLTTQISEVQEEQLALKDRQEKFEKMKRDHDLNKLRDRLLQSYRYYTAQQTWSEMEHEAFFCLLKDYYSLGGNSFIKEVVEPAMRSLPITSVSKEE